MLQSQLPVCSIWNSNLEQTLPWSNCQQSYFDCTTSTLQCHFLPENFYFLRKKRPQKRWPHETRMFWAHTFICLTPNELFLKLLSLKNDKRCTLFRSNGYTSSFQNAFSFLYYSFHECTFILVNIVCFYDMYQNWTRNSDSTSVKCWLLLDKRYEENWVSISFKTLCKNLPGDTNTSIEEETVLGAEQV